MKFKVTVQAERPMAPDDKYASFTDVYEQIVEDMDVNAVIKAVNGFSV